MHEGTFPICIFFMMSCTKKLINSFPSHDFKEERDTGNEAIKIEKILYLTVFGAIL